MELRDLPILIGLIGLVYMVWIGSGPARDERRARKAKRP